MRDAALEVLESTYPQGEPLQASKSRSVTPTRTHRPPRMYKGKGKAKADSVAPLTPLYGFKFQKDAGYICIACNRLCPKPALHRTMPNGGCMEFASSTALGYAAPAVVQSGDHCASNPPTVTKPIQQTQIQGYESQMHGPTINAQMNTAMEQGIGQASQDVWMEELVPWNSLTFDLDDDDAGRRLSQSAGLYF